MCALRHTGRRASGISPQRIVLILAYVAVNGDIVVMKFGGTSVAAAEDIRRAAGRIVAARENGRQVVAVLSARGKTTDDLLKMAHEVSDRPLAREMDMLLSTGERISCALCAMAIHDMGHSAISLTGSQAGIVTDSSHTQARIIDVRADRIREALGDDPVPGLARGDDPPRGALDLLGPRDRGTAELHHQRAGARLGGREIRKRLEFGGRHGAKSRVTFRGDPTAPCRA